MGLAAVVTGMGLVLILFASILMRGVPAFWQATFHLDVHFDPELIRVDQKPERRPDEGAMAYRARELAWMSQERLDNWQQSIDEPLKAEPAAIEPRQSPHLRSPTTSAD